VIAKGCYDGLSDAVSILGKAGRVTKWTITDERNAERGARDMLNGGYSFSGDDIYI